ncbi:alpha-2-macroglobulin like 1, partial [Homo sapiens]
MVRNNFYAVRLLPSTCVVLSQTSNCRRSHQDPLAASCICQASGCWLIGKGSLVMEGQKHLNSKKKGLKASFSLSLTFTSRL